MKNTIGFFGGGNMGRAIMGGLIKTGLYQPSDILVYDVHQPTLDKLSSELGLQTSNDMTYVAENSQIIILSVKPNVLPSVLKAIAHKISIDTLVVSIAAGITLQQLKELLSPQHKLIRVMPNTPALVAEGMSGICCNENLSAEEKETVLSIFSSFGKAELIPEKFMDAVVGVSGSSPAYVYMFIEALADGAVLEGLPRDQAYTFAAQAVYGSAKMVLETKKHPGELKDMVCSPGGTTIEAVKALEEQGFRAAVMNAVRVAAEKNKSM
ncbi:MAG: pyrroline-5-carboxylate reductase [Epulopiscium sp.]|nr:pyrroline-5-carboxylate reductase [Candidatus Epulonipiscium sp.]